MGFSVAPARLRPYINKSLPDLADRGVQTLPETTAGASHTGVNQRQISDNLERVRDRVASAAQRSGRPEDAVQLVAVSKTWPTPVVQAAVDAGAHLLGENRVQEAQTKVPEVTGDPVWHLVGHLQRNKAKVAIELFDVIQSVDSARLARELGKQAVAAGKEVSVYLQVNTSGEASKFGVEPEALPELADQASSIDGLLVDGLMTIAAHTNDQDIVRRCFVQLRELRDRVSKDHPSIRELSMGMSGDYEMAIEEGATVVRVGTAIFGQRS